MLSYSSINNRPIVLEYSRRISPRPHHRAYPDKSLHASSVALPRRVTTNPPPCTNASLTLLSCIVSTAFNYLMAIIALHVFDTYQSFIIIVCYSREYQERVDYWIAHCKTFIFNVRVSYCRTSPSTVAHVVSPPRFVYIYLYYY